MPHDPMPCRSKRLCLLLAAALALAPGARAAAPDMTGTWRIDLPKPWGVTLHSYLVLRRDGSSLTGSVLVNNADELRVQEAHMEGAEAVFHVDWGWKFRIRPEGDNLHVVISYGGPGADVATAYPVAASATTPPAAPAIPELRTLPDNGLLRTPPMGWNSWNHFAEKVDDRVVRDAADAMVASGMAAAGYQYINIDDTWEGGRDAAGNIVTNAKFPDMKALADYVHSKGLKLGIYSSPGFVTCGGYEGSLGHEAQDAATYAAWGIDYLKYDWCSAGRLYKIPDLRAVYQKMGDALEHCGRPIAYSLCEYGMGDVWSWAPKVSGNLWRTTGDIQDNWGSMTKIGFDQGKLAPFAGPGHWNDPDMLEIGNGGMSGAEYRTHFSLWCMLAAPLMAGNDLRSMSADTRDILTNREVIAVDQDALGMQGRKVLDGGAHEVWMKPLADGSRAVILFNRGTEAAPIAVSWEDVGLFPGGKARVRDLWKRADVGIAAGRYEAKVPPHGVVMVRITLQ
jgi:alpha-galactosidase